MRDEMTWAVLTTSPVLGKKLGEGTYATVFQAHVKSDPDSVVAIKKIKVNTEYRDGLALDAIREVKCLQELSHPNVIGLLAVFSSKNQNLNLVLEYLPRGDLEMLIKDTVEVTYGTADVKAWMGMICRGLWFCHMNFILHRDIKPNNIFIAADGELKLADFGLARTFAEPNRPMTYNVITRWYRPPELFLKARHYSGAVDVWSMGMVFAELILRTPFITGDTDVETFSMICRAFGTPTEANWPGVSKIPGHELISGGQPTPSPSKEYFQGMFGTVGPLGVDLLMSMVTLDPRKRSTAHQILRHKWWLSEPRPTKKEDLPKKGGGEVKMGQELKRRGGETPERRTDKVARKLDFAAMQR